MGVIMHIAKECKTSRAIRQCVETEKTLSQLLVQ